MTQIDQLFMEMLAFDHGSAALIQHFIKVHAFARIIGIAEGLTGNALITLEAAALVHDIGIRPAEAQYGHCDGKLQETVGPAYAEEMLNKLHFDAAIIQRVSSMVGHHHTYTNVDGLDLRILLEADFLVNLFESQLAPDAIRAAREQIFETRTGTQILQEMCAL